MCIFVNADCSTIGDDIGNKDWLLLLTTFYTSTITIGFYAEINYELFFTVEVVVVIGDKFVYYCCY